jgi:hypothetical protein
MKIKRHFSLILLILGIILAAVVYSRMMAMVATKYIGDFLRQELGEVMGKAIVVKRVSWNPLGQITLHEAKLTTVDKDGPIPIIEAGKIQTDLTIWDIFLKEFRRPLGKIILVKPRLYFGTKQQSFLQFYNPMKKGRLRRFILPRLFIQEGEVLVLDPERKTIFGLKSISGFIDPTIPVRARISIWGEPRLNEYRSFSFRGFLNLLTLAHDLKLDWQGLRLASLKVFIGGVNFKNGLVDINLRLERRKEFIDPWQGYLGEINIRDGLAIVNNIATPVKIDGAFKLKGQDFLSEKFLARLGRSRFSGEGRLFFFGEPAIEMSFRSSALEIEDLVGLTNLGTASGACGQGTLALRAFGKLSQPSLKGEINFPEIRAFSSSIHDFSSSFSGESGSLYLEQLSMGVYDGYFTAEGRISERVDIRFNLKEADLKEVCNGLAYSKLVESQILSNYLSQAKGKMSVGGLINGPIKASRVTGSFSGRNIEVGNQAFEKVEAEFEYGGGEMKFKPLQLGERYCLWSDYRSYPRKELELSLQLNKVNLEELVSGLDLKLPSPFTGQVSGKIEVKGPPEKIESRGHLSIEGGTISEINFEKMDLCFQGVGREIDIEDSSISQEKGKILAMRGKIFLGDNNGNSTMEIKPSATGFVWEGWNIEKDADHMEFNMGRKIAQNWYLNFSTPIDNVNKFPLKDRPPQPDTADKAELQYKLDEERKLKLHWRDKEEFVGLEQKFKF